MLGDYGHFTFAFKAEYCLVGLVLGENLSMAKSQEFYDLILASGERHLFRADKTFLAPHGKTDWANYNCMLLPPLISPKVGIDSRTQFGNAKRLGKIVICTVPQTPYNVSLPCLCCKEKNWAIHPRANLITKLKSVHPWHHNIKQNQLILV
jgi:hypothetical protein